ncbi:hypothetical protein ACLBX9_02210 [Methylobacterium sp. A49B]
MQRHAILGAAAVLILSAATARAEAPPDLPAPKRNAAKIAGLVGFVNVHCGQLRTDSDRFKRAVQALGVDPAELDRDALLLEARSYLAAYEKDVPSSCQRADDLFGPGGKVIPGLFLPR